MEVFNILVFNKNAKREEYFLKNQLHNISTFFDVLPNFPFATREMMKEYFLSTWYI